MAVNTRNTRNRRLTRSALTDAYNNVAATGTPSTVGSFDHSGGLFNNLYGLAYNAGAITGNVKPERGMPQSAMSGTTGAGGVAGSTGGAGGAATSGTSSGGDGFSFADSQFGLGEAGARRRFTQSQLGSQLRLGELGRQTQRQSRDVSRAYRQAAPQQITGFTGRGLGRSGLFRQAMQDFAGQQQRDLSDIAQSQAAGQAQIELERQQNAIALQDELDRLELQRQQQILADAAALQEFAPIAGLI